MDTSAPGTAMPVSGSAASEAEEFVRFCYRRRPVRWPDLYDEMCAVASRRAFRGWGFVEMAEHGICFTLADLRRLAAIAEQVACEGSGADGEAGRRFALAAVN